MFPSCFWRGLHNNSGVLCNFFTSFQYCLEFVVKSNFTLSVYTPLYLGSIYLPANVFMTDEYHNPWQKLCLMLVVVAKAKYSGIRSDLNEVFQVVSKRSIKWAEPWAKQLLHVLLIKTAKTFKFKSRITNSQGVFENKQ